MSVFWTIRNIIADLILPPGAFFILITVGLVAGRTRRWGRWLAGASLAAFLALSLNVVAFQLLKPFERHWPPLDPARERALAGEQAMIVVLGGGRTLGALEYPEHETLASRSLRGTIYAARLAARTGLPLAVSGGAPGGGRLSEAELMKELLENTLSRPVAVVEDRSADTHENAVNTARMLAARNTRTVVLVTDVFHMPRAAREFEAAGLTVIPAPIYFHASAPLGPLDFLPSMDGLQASRSVLKEYIGAVWYGLRRAVSG